MTATEAKSMVEVELESIAAKFDGNLPAQAVVDAARNPASPLHDRFEWDDTVAAERFRLAQARHLIATVTIVPHESTVTRAWVSLTTDRESDSPVYRPALKVLSTADLRQQLLEMAKDELGRVRRKHASLTELANVWAAIDEAQA